MPYLSLSALQTVQTLYAMNNRHHTLTRRISSQNNARSDTMTAVRSNRYATDKRTGAPAAIKITVTPKGRPCRDTTLIAKSQNTLSAAHLTFNAGATHTLFIRCDAPRCPSPDSRTGSLTSQPSLCREISGYSPLHRIFAILNSRRINNVSPIKISSFE